MMNNRFNHITSNKRKSEATLQSGAPKCAEVKGKPSQQRIGRNAYDTLVSLLAEDTETPLTPHGVFIANSTKRKLKAQIEELFLP